MGERYITLKAWPETLKKLRILSALLNERMAVILDRLVSEALAKALRSDGKELP